MLKYLVAPKSQMQEMTATIMDFLQVMFNIVRQYTSFLEYFGLTLRCQTPKTGQPLAASGLS